MPLRLAVADIGREITRPVATCGGNALANRLDHIEQTDRPRMRIAERALDDYLGFRQILDRPTGTDPQRIELRGENAVFLASQLAALRSIHFIVFHVYLTFREPYSY